MTNTRLYRLKFAFNELLCKMTSVESFGYLWKMSVILRILRSVSYITYITQCRLYYVYYSVSVLFLAALREAKRCTHNR